MTYRNRFYRNTRQPLTLTEAKAYLDDAGLGAALECYQVNCGNANYRRLTKDEQTIADLVGGLIRWRSMSDKQKNFCKMLLDRKAERQARFAAEAAAAADCPTGKLTVTVTVIKSEWRDSRWGESFKMLAKHESGYKLWGTVPSGCDANKGDVIELTATIEPSQDDPKFGFYKRPAGRTVAEAVQEQPAQVQPQTCGGCENCDGENLCRVDAIEECQEQTGWQTRGAY
jgi:hypothetical protein